ncbi:unnamed protein product [Diamesa hyperborea]
MITNICGVSFDLVLFCLINGSIQLCESAYYAEVSIMELFKSDHGLSDNIRPILFVLMTLSGASLIYGAKKENAKFILFWMIIAVVEAVWRTSCIFGTSTTFFFKLFAVLDILVFAVVTKYYILINKRSPIIA